MTSDLKSNAANVRSMLGLSSSPTENPPRSKSASQHVAEILEADGAVVEKTKTPGSQDSKPSAEGSEPKRARKKRQAQPVDEALKLKAKRDARKAKKNQRATQHTPKDGPTPEKGRTDAVPEQLQHGEILLRADGNLPNAPLSDEFKQGIRELYEREMALNYNDISKALGVGVGTVCRVIADSPGLAERVRQNREVAIVDNLEAALAGMAAQLREAVEAREIVPTAKNIRDWAIAYGILTDKRQLVTGGATQRAELSVGTLEERKARMHKVLDRAEATLKLLKGGKQ